MLSYFRVCVRLRVVVSFVVRCFRVCVRLCVVGELNGRISELVA